jgi:hypothetical protein
MKYTLAFVNECKGPYLWYKDELKLFLAKHNMADLYNEKIEPINLYRWWPAEVFNALEK